MRRSTFGVLTAGLTLLTVAVGALVFPASVAAKTQPEIVVGANQSVNIKMPGLPQGPGYAYTRVSYLDPGFCGDGGEGDAFCDDFTLRVNLTPEQLRRNIYLLLVKLDWPGENNNVPAVATAANPQLAMTIWDNPIVEDEEPAPPCDNPELADGVPDPVGATCPAAEEKPGGDEPLFETGIDPKPLRWGTLVEKKLNFSIDIGNYAGVNDQYTLSVDVIQVEGSPDLSVDESITDLSAIDQSVDRPSAPSSGFDGFAAPGAGSGDALASLGLADLTADSTLDRLGIQGDTALGFDEDTARLLANRNVRDIRPPGDEATWALLLWLVVVPIVIAGAGVFWGLRRRSTLLAGI